MSSESTSGSTSALSVPESTSSQRCFLLNSTETRGLVEYYHDDDVTEYLAYFRPPVDKKIPKFKFTRNWGKSELTNFAKGDITGRSAYFSGICSWLRKAKSYNATIVFCNQLPGWECDLYFYLVMPVDGVQMVRVEYGEVFSCSNVDGVVILPLATDFIHHDPRSQRGIDIWLSEGAKLGYSSRLDVKPGSAFPKSMVPSSKPTGGSGSTFPTSTSYSKPHAVSGYVAQPQSVNNETRPKPKPSMSFGSTNEVRFDGMPVSEYDSGRVDGHGHAFAFEYKKETIECVYLDYNATTPIYPPVLEAMIPFLTDHFGNPSSSHYYGQKAKLAVDKARRSLLRVIGAGDGVDASSIVFTGCGTESNNLAIRLALLSSPHKKDKDGLIHVVSTNVEHPAITQCLDSYSSKGGGLTPKISVTYVPVDEEGIVSIDDVIDAIRPNTVLVTVMTANNEVGSIQPVFGIAKECRARRVIFHTDAAQAVGKMDLRELANSPSGADMVTLVGHKFGAPKGVAALYIRPGVFKEQGRRDPENGGSVLLLGGGQEGGRRGGTEGVHNIVGMGRAAEMLFEKRKGLDGRLADGWQANVHHMEAMHKRLFMNIIKELDVEYCRFMLGVTKEFKATTILLNGPSDPDQRLPNTLSIGINGINSGELLANIGNFVACSAGSACHSSSSETTSYSSVLKAMNVPPKHAVGTLRLSVGPYTTEEEVDVAAEIIVKEAKRQLKRTTASKHITEAVKHVSIEAKNVGSSIGRFIPKIKKAADKKDDKQDDAFDEFLSVLGD